MSFQLGGKLLRIVGIAAVAFMAWPAVSWGQHLGAAPCATFGTPCAVGCQTHHCPPAFKYCYEGSPRIHWTRGCPHPICNPCELPNWGYFETCWTPWPYQPTYAHCPMPPPAAFVPLNPGATPLMPPVRSTIPGGSSGFEEVPLLPPPRQR